MIQLEICLASKAITDEGLVAVCGGLLDAIEHDVPTNTSLVLEELNLAGNKLTVKSLEALVPVIELSSGWLKDLDLSENDISIKTPEDAEAWGDFLGAFSKCHVLRRLDLSSNDFSNSMAFEILVREYVQQREMVRRPIDSVVEKLEQLHVSDSPKRPSEKSPKGAQRRASGRHDLSVSTPEPIHVGTTEKLTGLRSVAYIVLKNVKMNGTGALWLSQLVENHRMPEQLMSSPPKPGPMESVFRDYRRENRCFGVVYGPNKTLTPLGSKILQAAEVSRRTKLKMLEHELQDDIDYMADEDDGNGVDDVDHTRFVTMLFRLRSDGRQNEAQTEPKDDGFANAAVQIPT
jgi:hypothetical protein